MLTYRVDSKWNATGLGPQQSALRLEDLEQIIDRHDNALVNGNTNKMSVQERTARAKLLEDAKAEYAKIPKAMAVTEGIVGDLPVFLRGNHLTKGPSPRGDSRRSSPATIKLPSALGQRTARARPLAGRAGKPAHGPGHGEPRLALAFRPGAGPDRRQLREAWPSPPRTRELLDWLATQFIRDGWSLKALHRRIMASRIYRMSTAWDEHAARLTRRTACSGACPVPGWMRRHFATRSCQCADDSTRRMGGEAILVAGAVSKPDRHGRARPRPSSIRPIGGAFIFPSSAALFTISSRPSISLTRPWPTGIARGRRSPPRLFS